MKSAISQAGLHWKVVESVPIHESIKLGLSPDRDKYIQNYIITLKNLSACGIRVVAYHFMPLLDWTRTTLNYPFWDGSFALAFDKVQFAAFELFILEDESALERYDENIQVFFFAFYYECFSFFCQCLWAFVWSSQTALDFIAYSRIRGDGFG